MDQELPAPADRARLGLILSRWREWSAPLSGEPDVVRKLGGLSNDNYLVRSGDRHFVVRLNNDRFELGVDRNVERRILGDIAHASFAPSIVYASDHCLVTRFIEGEHPHAPDPAGMGRLFRQIHLTQSGAVESLDPRLHLASYMRRVTRPPTRLQACFKAVMSRRDEAPIRANLCHNDLLLSNILDTGNGLVVIDWEYARPGDPAFDMAVFAQTYNLDDAATSQLLAAYDPDDAGLASRITHYRDVYALIEICWWLIRGRDAAELSPQIDRLADRLDLG